MVDDITALLARTRSRVKATVVISIVLNSSAQKMVKTKQKNHLSIVQLQLKLPTVPFLGVTLIFEGHRRSPKVTDESENANFGSKGFLGQGFVAVMKTN